MPRKFFKRKFTSRRRHTRRAPTVKRIVRAVNRQQNRQKEVKCKWTMYGPIQANVVPFLVSLIDLPPQGTGSYTNEETAPGNPDRIGNSIYVRSIQLNVELNIGAVNIEHYGVVRLTIFQWFQDTSNEVPAYGDIYMNTASTTGMYLAPINSVEARARKFKILHDRHIPLSTYGNNAQKVVKFKLTKFPIHRLQATTDTDSGVTGNIIKGKIYMFVTSDVGALDDPPAVNLSYRMNFTDE